MKNLKGSLSAVKMKYLIFVFAAAMLTALPTRVYQLLAIVDYTNGFYNGNDVTIPVLYGAIFIFALIFMALSFLSKEVPSPKLPTGKNPVLGIGSIIMVVGLGWDILAIEKKVVPQVQGGFSFDMFKSLFTSNLEQNGGAFLVLEFIFAIFAIFYLLIFAVSHLNGKASYKEYKLLALSPLCWAITMLISKLMTAVSFIKVSELLFEIFMLVFAMLFFLTFARISSGVFTEDSMWGIYGYGFSAALFAGLVTVPRLVCAVVGLPYVEGYEFNFAHLAILLFVLSYIVASLGVGFKDGLKNIRTIAEVQLPSDEDVVVKHSKPVAEEIVNEEPEYELLEEAEEESFEEPEEVEEAEEIEEPVFFEEAPAAVEEPVQEVVEETVEEDNFFDNAEIIAEEAGEEVVEEAVEEAIAEEPAEEIIKDIVEAETKEIVEEATEEVEEAVEEIVEEETEEVAEEAIEETFEEPVEDAFEEVAEIGAEVSEESVVIEAPVQAPKANAEKPKKDKKSLFGLRKAPVVEEEIAEDLKPISLADMKKNQQK